MANPEITRVLVIDPSFLFYQGVAQSLAAGRWQLVGWAQGSEYAIASCKPNAIDLALIGHGFSPRDGLTLCRALRAQCATIKIILLSEHAESALFQEDAVHAGADCCLLPSINTADFLTALDAVTNGEPLPHPSGFETGEPPRVTQREIEILRLAAHGKTDKEIAQTLQISVNTVRNHMQNILRKLQVNDREAAVWRARHYDLI